MLAAPTVYGNVLPYTCFTHHTNKYAIYIHTALIKYHVYFKQQVILMFINPVRV